MAAADGTCTFAGAREGAISKQADGSGNGAVDAHAAAVDGQPTRDIAAQGQEARAKGREFVGKNPRGEIARDAGTREAGINGQFAGSKRTVRQRDRAAGDRPAVEDQAERNAARSGAEGQSLAIQVDGLAAVFQGIDRRVRGQSLRGGCIEDGVRATFWRDMLAE